MQNVVKSAPEPPYSSGNGSPNSPSSPMASTVSTGKVWSRSHCSAWGAIAFSAKSRTTPRNDSCSSVKSKSTGLVCGSKVDHVARADRPKAHADVDQQVTVVADVGGRPGER